jgi:hypothetical protein
MSWLINKDKNYDEKYLETKICWIFFIHRWNDKWLTTLSHTHTSYNFKISTTWVIIFYEKFAEIFIKTKNKIWDVYKYQKLFDAT